MRLILILLLSLITIFTYSQENKDLAMCCTTKKEVGRCTGSASCTACRNCSRCKYCSQQGGSCGVCSSSSSSNSYYNYSTKKRKKTTKTNTSNNSYYSTTTNSYNSNTSNNNNNNNVYYLANDTSSKYYFKTLMVNSKTLNLREGPSIYYDILEELGHNQKLTFLAMTGEWVKVKVKSTKTIGFVHKDYVLVVNL